MTDSLVLIHHTITITTTVTTTTILYNRKYFDSTVILKYTLEWSPDSDNFIFSHSYDLNHVT